MQITKPTVALFFGITSTIQSLLIIYSSSLSQWEKSFLPFCLHTDETFYSSRRHKLVAFSQLVATFNILTDKNESLMQPQKMAPLRSQQRVWYNQHNTWSLMCCLGQTQYRPVDLDTASLKMYWNIVNSVGGEAVWRRLIHVLKEVAEKHQTTVACVAMQWVMSQEGGDIAFPIIGIYSPVVSYAVKFALRVLMLNSIIIHDRPSVAVRMWLYFF